MSYSRFFIAVLLFSFLSCVHANTVLTPPVSFIEESYDLPRCIVAVAAKNGTDEAGKSKEMEDACVIDPQGDDVFLAAFDGHGGVNASAVARDILHKTLYTFAEKKGLADYEKTITDAFLSADLEIQKRAPKSGTTAAVAWLKGEYLYVANVGDSSVVVVFNHDDAHAEAREHKPGHEDEKARIISEDRGKDKVGLVYTKNLGDGSSEERMMTPEGLSLGMSRSLGDARFKPYGIIAAPAVTRYEAKKIAYVFLLSDGVMDIIGDLWRYKYYDEASRGAVLRNKAYNYKEDSNVFVTEKSALRLVKYLRQYGEDGWGGTPDDTAIIFAAMKHLQNDSEEAAAHEKTDDLQVAKVVKKKKQEPSTPTTVAVTAADLEQR